MLYLTRAPVQWRSEPTTKWTGGICNYRPLLTQNPIGLERRGKKHSRALNSTFERYLDHFSSQSNIRVPRGHQRSKFDRCYYIFFFRKRAVVSGTVIARRAKMIPIVELLLLIRSQSKVTSGQRLSLHRSSIVKIVVTGEIFFTK